VWLAGIPAPTREMIAFIDAEQERYGIEPGSRVKISDRSLDLVNRQFVAQRPNQL